MTPDLAAVVQRSAPLIVDIYRRLHRIPEVAWKERRTAEFLAAALEQLGLQYTTPAGGGLLATCGPQGGAILLRADMDAVPVQEATGLSFASQHDGLMHACGHDVHMAILVGAAAVLKEVEQELAGGVLFLFQPAEEQPPGGACRLLDNGFLEQWPVEAAFALHVDPQLSCGSVGLYPGVAMAAVDNFDIAIHGRGGHAALPHLGVDPIFVSAVIVQALQQIVSRQSDPLDPLVISLGKIQGGTEYNIVPQLVELKGTVRTISARLREAVPRQIERLLAGITAGFDARYSLDYTFGYPPLQNDAAMTALVEAAARLAGSGLRPVPLPGPLMVSEDFAYFLQRVPGCYAFLGTAAADKPHYPLHSPRFQIDERVLPQGTLLLATLAQLYWRQKRQPGIV